MINHFEARVRGAICVLAFAVFSVAVSAQQPKLTVPSGVTVFDAKGKLVGTMQRNLNFTIAQLNALVVFEVGGQLFQVTVQRDGFVGVDIVFWESTDCSGTAFFDVYSGSATLLPNSAIAPPGQTAYIPEANAIVRERKLRSMYYLGACMPYYSTDLSIPATPLIDMDTVFTPPFVAVSAGA